MSTLKSTSKPELLERALGAAAEAGISEDEIKAMSKNELIDFLEDIELESLEEIASLEGLDDVEWDEADLPEAELAEEQVAAGTPKRGRKTKDGKPKKERKSRAESRRFNAEQIREMVELYLTGTKKSAIAEKFSCSQVFVWNVVKGNVYKDVERADLWEKYPDPATVTKQNAEDLLED